MLLNKCSPGSYEFDSKLIQKNHQTIAVSVLAIEGDVSFDYCTALAQRLAVPVTNDIHDNGGLVLACQDGRLVLYDARDQKSRPLCIDFSAQDLRPYGPNLSRRQPLARALGKHNRTVIDATAGLGQDAFLMAAMGYLVLAIERSQVLAALLDDAITVSASDPRLARTLRGKLTTLAGDARKLIPLQEPVDVIYLDPMFPPKRSKSALPRRELVLLRELVGEDPDADQLFLTALQHAKNRVVVKRPLYAPPLVREPDFSQTGKLVRYDVYLC